jgi:hypothetical protein
VRPVVLTLAIAILTPACSHQKATAPTGPSSPTPPAATLVRIWVSSSIEIWMSGTPTPFQFNARALYSDDSVKDISTLATWRSSNPAVAPISSTGIVNPLAPGAVVITASYGGLEASLNCHVVQDPARPPAANEIMGYVSEFIPRLTPISLDGAEVEIIGGSANGRTVHTGAAGLFRIGGLQAPGFDLIVRMRGYTSAGVHVGSLGRRLDINLAPAPGMVRDVLQGDVCLPTRTISRTFRPQAPAFLRVSTGHRTVPSLYANGILVKADLFRNSLNQDIELSAGVTYELRATGYCVVDVEDSPLTPAGYVSFLRPAD